MRHGHNSQQFKAWRVLILKYIIPRGHPLGKYPSSGGTLVNLGTEKHLALHFCSKIVLNQSKIENPSWRMIVDPSGDAVWELWA